MTDKMYYLNIYYRSHAAKQDETGAIVLDSSPGHSYVGLQGHDNNEEFFGLYKPNGIPIGIGKLLSVQEKIMHERLLMLSSRDKKNYIFAKQISLTEEQYNKAVTFAEDRRAKDNTYIFGLSDCVDFTQSVYNAAGLPLHFTQIYSSEELSQLPNLASYKMSLKYDISKPGLINVKGLTKGQIASELNIPVERIEPVVHMNLNADMDVRQTFQINLKDSDFLPKNLVVKFTPTLELNSTRTQDNQQLPSTSQGERDENLATVMQKLLTLAMGRLENKSEKLEKLMRLKQKFNELIKKHESKVNGLIKDFIDDKTKTLNARQNDSTAAINNAITEIINQMQSYNEQIFAQKQAELTAETEARKAAVKANSATNNLMNHSMMPQVITISNADIAARKQSEYDSMVKSHESNCKTQIEQLKAQARSQAQQLQKDQEQDINSKIDAVKNKADVFAQELSSQVHEMLAKINQSENIDIDTVERELDDKASVFFRSLEQFVE